MDFLGQELARWIRPLFQQWWGQLAEGERAVLKKAVAGENVTMAGMGDAERRAAQRMVDCGFVVEEGGRLAVGGKVWREFVRDVG